MSGAQLFHDLTQEAFDKVSVARSFAKDGAVAQAADACESAAALFRQASELREAYWAGLPQHLGLPAGRHDVGFPKGGAA